MSAVRRSLELSLGKRRAGSGLVKIHSYVNYFRKAPVKSLGASKKHHLRRWGTFSKIINLFGFSFDNAYLLESGR